MNQKDVFLASEGDAWYERNRAALAARAWPDDDPVLRALLELGDGELRGREVFEVGCGEALRLEWLQRERACRCSGVEPSARAVEAARRRGVSVHQGTADRLPRDDQSVDVLIFGFCLYLCDRSDLFRVAAEADRVLRSPGWILIQDFHASSPTSRDYHHRPGVRTYKMDYRQLFTWHPQYQCLSHLVRHHETGLYTDSLDDQVAVSVLRKRA